MIILDRYLFLIMWIGWAIYWWVTARNVKANTWREPLASRLAHVSALVLAGYLLWKPRIPIPGLDKQLWPSGAAPFWIGAGLTAAGLLFSVWARVHIGRNWSGTVTLKEGHELITSGPYSLVRHPIYTGMLVAFAGTAIARGDAQGILAFLIAAVTLWLKLRFEERGMRRQFGGAYEAYVCRVRALIPFLF